MKRLSLLLCVLGFTFSLTAQDTEQPSPIIFIYDASGSMWGQLQGTTKMEIASEVLSKSVNSLPENQQVGLVAYGHREEGNCRDVEFLVDIENDSKALINTSLSSIKPLGKTPLTYSAMQVIDQLRNSGKKATIILITDGIESCDGNICEVVTAARAEGIDFRLHIVGFGLQDEETAQLKCAAKAGTGNYYDAGDAGALSEVLNEATGTTVDEPAGNFSVYTIKNGKPIDAVIKAFHTGTDTEVDGIRTYADTSFLYLPAGVYDLKASPLATQVNPIIVRSVQSFADSTAHKTISFDGAKLQMSTLNNDEGWDTLVKIKSKDGKTVGQARTYGRPKVIEVNPDLYDIELTALVMKGLNTTHTIKDVELTAGEIKELEHSFKTGIAMIGARSGEELVDATVGIADANTSKGITGSRTYTSPNNNPRKFILNPGLYTVTMRSLGKHAGKEEFFTIEVKEGETVEKIINF